MTEITYFKKTFKLPSVALEKRFQCGIIKELLNAIKDAPDKVTASGWEAARDRAIKKAYLDLLKEI